MPGTFKAPLVMYNKVPQIHLLHVQHSSSNKFVVYSIEKFEITNYKEYLILIIEYHIKYVISIINSNNSQIKARKI